MERYITNIQEIYKKNILLTKIKENHKQHDKQQAHKY